MLLGFVDFVVLQLVAKLLLLGDELVDLERECLGPIATSPVCPTTVSR